MSYVICRGKGNISYDQSFYGGISGLIINNLLLTASHWVL